MKITSRFSANHQTFLSLYPPSPSPPLPLSGSLSLHPSQYSCKSAGILPHQLAQALSETSPGGEQHIPARTVCEYASVCSRGIGHIPFCHLPNPGCLTSSRGTIKTDINGGRTSRPRQKKEMARRTECCNKSRKSRLGKRRKKKKPRQIQLQSIVCDLTLTLTCDRKRGLQTGCEPGKE